MLSKYRFFDVLRHISLPIISRQVEKHMQFPIAYENSPSVKKPFNFDDLWIRFDTFIDLCDYSWPLM